MTLRTHHCGTLTKADVGKEVTLSGWVQRYRDLGGVLFIDLRDRTGIVQIVFNPAFSKEAHEIADRARSEYVITVPAKWCTAIRRRTTRTSRRARSRCA